MKEFKFVYSIALSFLISIITFIGCQQEDVSNELYDRGAYLSLPPNVDYAQLTNANLKILSDAFARLEIKEDEDGLLEIIQDYGMDINISEDLFDYFQLIIKTSNKKILSDIYLCRNRVQTRQEGGSSSTDCLAQSISYATGMNYNEVNSWITGTYGNNGVPADKVYSVLNHFSNGVQVPSSMFRDMNISEQKKYIIVIGASHAVTVERKIGDSVMYWDAQNGQRGVCSASNITHIYELRK